MPTIADLPDVPRYNIKHVAQQTGILPVTLRAWERRYRMLTPRRSGSNYRLYSDREIAMLRWLRHQVDAGLRVQMAVEELHALRRSGKWPEVLPPLENLRSRRPGNPPSAFSARLFQALAAQQEAKAAQVLSQVHAEFDVATICLEVIIPCLVEIGEAWHRGEIRIATEHMASTFLRGRLLTLYQAFPVRRRGHRLVVGAAPGERHEIGALIFSLLARRAGYWVEYLGPDVELDDLVDFVRMEKPAMVCLAATTREPALRLQQVDSALARQRPRPRFGYGGRAFNSDPRLRELVAGEFLGETLGEALGRIAALLRG
jgi:MerR family transcriptional regulator, light-induced transcriptional regulator